MGKCDCIISDGHTGNVAIKTTEGFAKAMTHFFLSQVKKDFFGLAGLFLMKNSLNQFRKIVDYSEYGGALLLGISGVVIIGHGHSNAKAVKNAVKVACREVEINVNKEIESRINEQTHKVN